LCKTYADIQTAYPGRITLRYLDPVKGSILNM